MLIVCLAQAKAGEVVVLVASVCYDVVMCFLPLQTVRENGFNYRYQTFTIRIVLTMLSNLLGGSTMQRDTGTSCCAGATYIYTHTTLFTKAWQIQNIDISVEKENIYIYKQTK